MVSGTNGLAGACDAILVLKRQRGAAGAELLVTGRDVEESKYALAFQPDICSWQLLDGAAEDYELGDTRRAVITLLREHEAMTPKEVVEHLDITQENAKKTLQRMFKDDQVDTDGTGHYFVPVSPVPRVPPVPLHLLPGDTGDTGDPPERGTDA
jgi:hypothetical protein